MSERDPLNQELDDLRATVAEQTKLLADAYGALLQARDAIGALMPLTAIATQHLTKSVLPLSIAIDRVENWKQRKAKELDDDISSCLLG